MKNILKMHPKKQLKNIQMPETLSIILFTSHPSFSFQEKKERNSSERKLRVNFTFVRGQLKRIIK